MRALFSTATVHFTDLQKQPPEVFYGKRCSLNDCFYILFKTSWSLINQPIKKFVFTEFLFSFTILSKRKLRMHRIANLRSKHALLVEN